MQPIRFIKSSCNDNHRKQNVCDRGDFDAKNVYEKIVECNNIAEVDQIPMRSKISDQINTVCPDCKLVIETSIERHNLTISHQICSNSFSKLDDNGLQAPISSQKHLGYHLLRKEGWNGRTGLGLNEQGRRYPIKAKIKSNRNGIGFETDSNLKQSKTIKSEEVFDKKMIQKRKNHQKKIEIEFRRSFYEDGII